MALPVPAPTPVPSTVPEQPHPPSTGGNPAPVPVPGPVAGHEYLGIRIPDALWNAAVAAARMFRVPLGLILSLNIHENPSFSNGQSTYVHPNASLNWNGHEDSWGQLQLATFGVGHGYSREILQDPAQNYQIGARHIRAEYDAQKAKDPSASDSELWKRAIHAWSVAEAAWQAWTANPDVPESAADPSGGASPVTPGSGGSWWDALISPITSIGTNISAGIQKAITDAELFGLRIALSAAGLLLMAFGLFQLDSVKKATATAQAGLTKAIMVAA